MCILGFIFIQQTPLISFKLKSQHEFAWVYQVWYKFGKRWVY